jgi:hypothetical protein
MSATRSSTEIDEFPDRDLQYGVPAIAGFLGLRPRRDRRSIDGRIDCAGREPEAPLQALHGLSQLPSIGVEAQFDHFPLHPSFTIILRQKRKTMPSAARAGVLRRGAPRQARASKAPTPRVRFTGDGWYRVLLRSAWEAPGTWRDVWIAEIKDSCLDDQIGMWPGPEVAGQRRHVIARRRRDAIERNIVARLSG